MKLPTKENKIFSGNKASLDEGSARRKAATYTHNNTNRMNAQTSVPVVGFEQTTPEFERAKRVHALDSVATVIGKFHNYAGQAQGEQEETFICLYTVFLCKHS
jgi:hypothetical protein